MATNATHSPLSNYPIITISSLNAQPITSTLIHKPKQHRCKSYDLLVSTTSIESAKKLRTLTIKASVEQSGRCRRRRPPKRPITPHPSCITSSSSKGRYGPSFDSSDTVPDSRHFKLCHCPFSIFNTTPPGTISTVSTSRPSES